MRLETTKKQIKENTHPDHLLAVGYCDLQYLLRFEKPFAYSKGVCGWSCDYYEIEFDNQTYIISTGYSPIGKMIDYDLTKNFEEKARLYARSEYATYGKRKKGHDRLLNKFMEEVTK
tara:strand:- start:1034 stop:1384 length:351 start_codon:yes stop_codon:yes gene_type:complete